MHSARQPATQLKPSGDDLPLATDASMDWRLPEPVLRIVAAAAPVWRVISPVLPVLTTAAITILVMLGFYERHFHTIRTITHHLSSFADVGARFAQHAGLQRFAVNNVGYDGQYNFYLARNPGLIVSCAHTHATCPMDSLLLVRMERILYPMLAWVVSLGHARLVPLALLLINFVAILALVVVLQRMFVRMGVSPWLAVAGAIYGGNLVGFVRDLADPLGVLFVVLAVYLVYRQRPLWAALAVAAALLSREQAIFYLPLLALPLIAERRWRTLALAALIALGPFLAWQGVLYAIYGKFALVAGDTGAAKLIPIPFYGLWQDRLRPDFALTVAGVLVPVLVALLIAVLAVARRGLRDLLRDPLPLMIAVYLTLLSFTYWFQWADFRAPSRLAAPGLMLALIVVARLPHPGLRASYATLLAITALSPVILIIR